LPLNFEHEDDDEDEHELTVAFFKQALSKKTGAALTAARLAPMEKSWGNLPQA
jgi:hypothetical protein